MTLQDLRELCTRRRSIRYFDQKPVSKELLTEIVSVAQMAPSVENLQPWKFHLVTNAGVKKKLMDASCYGNFVAGAAAFIVVTMDKKREKAAPEPVWNQHELEYSCVNAILLAELAATAMNLGSCWVSLQNGLVHEILALPRTESVVGGIMIGHYKSGEEQPSRDHNRRPLEQDVVFHE